MTILAMLWATGTVFGADAYSENAPPAAIAAAVRRIQEERVAAENRSQQQTSNATLAWELARACFDCADLASNNTHRAHMAQAGMDAAQRAIALAPKLGAAYYYLGLNQGQLARTRKLTALGLLKDIERSWNKAIELDPAFDFAGPHRSIGILYRDAPGWPVSLGDRTKARQHLEKAAQLAPHYPDNQISLLESYMAWGNQKTVRTQIPVLQPKLDTARAQLTGALWELSWHDWDHRWKLLQSKIASPRMKSPRSDD